MPTLSPPPWRRVLGLTLLGVVVTLWTASSFVASVRDPPVRTLAVPAH